MGEGGETEGWVHMTGGVQRITVLMAIAAITLTAACSGSDDSSPSDADDGPSSSVAFEKLDAVFEPIPPGGGDDWLTYRDDFTGAASGLADFSYDTSSGTRGDGTYELELDEPEDFISNSGFGGRSRRVTVQATVGSTGTATDAGFGVLCLRDDSGAFFYGGVGNDGTYAIGRAEDGTRSVLTGNGRWVPSPAIELNQDEYTVRLTCNEESTGAEDGPITVTLTVDGQEIDSVQAPTTGGTDAGIFLLAFAQPDAAATFSSFLVATGHLGAEDDPGRVHDYQRLVLNQPSAVGSCRQVAPSYFHTRFPATYVASCDTGAYLPGTSITFFAYRDPSDSPEPAAARARATYRALLDQVGLKAGKDEAVAACSSPGSHQGRLLGLDDDDRVRPAGAFTCGVAKDGRTFVIAHADGRGRADAAIAVIPAKQRGAFVEAVTRDFAGIPTVADSISFDDLE
jgi:hypothetical protein